MAGMVVIMDITATITTEGIGGGYTIIEVTISEISILKIARREVVGAEIIQDILKEAIIKEVNINTDIGNQYGPRLSNTRIPSFLKDGFLVYNK